MKGKGELKFVFMNEPKLAAGKKMRSVKKIVCWEMTYKEFVEFLENARTAHHKMPTHVKDFINSMGPDDYKDFTRHQSVVFYRDF